MIEIAVVCAAVVAMVRIAAVEGKSPALWGVITSVSCGLAILFVPAPFLRVGMGFGLSFAAMFVANIVGKPG